MKNFFKSIFYHGPNSSIVDNFKNVDEMSLSSFENVLKEKYLKSKWKGETDNDYYQNDLNNQLDGRLQKFRINIVSWINSIKPLKNSVILEIGCGTGSSTVALAEQGAKVTGIDIDDISLEVAKARIELYHVKADFCKCNAVEIADRFKDSNFDVIIFFATLEHMTYQERIDSLRAASSLLKSGAVIFVIETPNRLWLYDFHTSSLPFYFWLPDDLAFDYSRYSKRKNFNEKYKQMNNETLLEFQRRGRGVSFHEFELAIDVSKSFTIASSLESYRKVRFLSPITDRLKSRNYFVFKKILRDMGPKYHDGFYEPWLDLALIKK